MWASFRRTPIRFAYDAEYGSSRGETTWLLPLDKVETFANIVSPAEYQFSVFAWNTINLQATFEAEVLLTAPTATIYRRTDAKYAEHIACLYQWGLLATIGNPLITAKYFAVVKRGAEPHPDSARTIHDGREFNNHCHRAHR
jgi:hypothetical protein